MQLGVFYLKSEIESINKIKDDTLEIYIRIMKNVVNELPIKIFKMDLIRSALKMKNSRYKLSKECYDDLKDGDIFKIRINYKNQIVALIDSQLMNNLISIQFNERKN